MDTPQPSPTANPESASAPKPEDVSIKDEQAPKIVEVVAETPRREESVSQADERERKKQLQDLVQARVAKLKSLVTQEKDFDYILQRTELKLLESADGVDDPDYDAARAWLEEEIGRVTNWLKTNEVRRAISTQKLHKKASFEVNGQKIRDTHYNVLHLDPNELFHKSPEDVLKSLKEKKKEVDALLDAELIDSIGDEAVKVEAEKLKLDAEIAYTLLSNPEQRRNYDMQNGILRSVEVPGTVAVSKSEVPQASLTEKQLKEASYNARLTEATSIASIIGILNEMIVDEIVIHGTREIEGKISPVTREPRAIIDDINRAQGSLLNRQLTSSELDERIDAITSVNGIKKKVKAELDPMIDALQMIRQPEATIDEIIESLRTLNRKDFVWLSNRGIRNPGEIEIRLIKVKGIENDLGAAQKALDEISGVDDIRWHVLYQLRKHASLWAKATNRVPEDFRKPYEDYLRKHNLS